VQRVDKSAFEAGCGAPANPVSGAAATVDCQPVSQWQGITVTAASFPVTGQAIPFDPSLIPGESSGLNAYLASILPSGDSPDPATNAPECSPANGTSCLTVGFSGLWGEGRVYCYQAGGTSYVVWTFDNDSYESSHNEDFVVVASSSSASSVINFWNQTPV